MIEAALLALELLFVLALLWGVNNATKHGAPKNLGIFDFKQLRTDADTSLRNKVKKRA